MRNRLGLQQETEADAPGTAATWTSVSASIRPQCQVVPGREAGEAAEFTGPIALD